MKIEFDIPKAEALRYAGHKGGRVPPAVDRTADTVIEQLVGQLTPKYIAGRFKIQPVENGVKLAETGLVLQGADIQKHLDGCGECYIICATVGLMADSFIRSSLAMDTVRGMLSDGRRTAAVESYCNMIEAHLRNRLKSENKYLTRRYSPGYGDFPFTQQPEILALLNAAKLIGVTANQSCIMTPSKSVTAVMGIADSKPAGKAYKCSGCPNKDNCDFSCR